MTTEISVMYGSEKVKRHNASQHYWDGTGYILTYNLYFVASELNDPIWHSSEWQIGSFSSEATIQPSPHNTYG